MWIVPVRPEPATLAAVQPAGLRQRAPASRRGQGANSVHTIALRLLTFHLQFRMHIERRGAHAEFEVESTKPVHGRRLVAGGQI